MQIRATGSAAHPPSTQSDGNGKPVCIHVLPASFVCAVKTIFLLRTSDKNCKKKKKKKRLLAFMDHLLKPTTPAKQDSDIHATLVFTGS